MSKKKSTARRQYLHRRFYAGRPGVGRNRESRRRWSPQGVRLSTQAKVTRKSLPREWARPPRSYCGWKTRHKAIAGDARRVSAALNKGGDPLRASKEQRAAETETGDIHHHRVRITDEECVRYRCEHCDGTVRT